MDLDDVISSLEQLQKNVKGRGSQPKVMADLLRSRRRRPPGSKIIPPADATDPKVLEELTALVAALRARKEPPLECVGVAVRVSRPKPKLPPAAVAAPLPPPEEAH